MTKRIPPIREKMEFTHGRCRSLTDEQVWEIRRKHIAGASKYALAKEYGVSRGTIYAAVHGERAYAGV